MASGVAAGQRGSDYINANAYKIWTIANLLRNHL